MGKDKREKRGNLKKLVRERRIDIWLLQESKQKSVDQIFVNSVWGNKDHGFLEVESEGSTGGLLSIWNPEVFILEEACCNRILLIRVGS